MGPPSVFEIFPPASSSASGNSSSSPAANNNADPSNMILQPTSRDILCGKDKTYAKHPGNAVYRATIAAQSSQYAELGNAKQAKMNLTKSIVEQLRQQGARFLQQKGDNSGVWTEITDQQARDKTSHALRFHQNKLAQAQQQQQQLESSTISSTSYNNSTPTTTASAAAAAALPQMVPSNRSRPPVASISTARQDRWRVDSDLTVLFENSERSLTPTDAIAKTNDRTEITRNDRIASPQQQQQQPNADSTRSVECCMSVLVEAAEQQAARELLQQQQQQQLNHSSDTMDYQPSDTLRSEDLNRLFQMGDHDWDSVMKQQNQSSVRSWSGLTVVGESLPQPPPQNSPYYANRGWYNTTSSNNSNVTSPNNHTATLPSSNTSITSSSVAQALPPPVDRSAMMQPYDSLRSVTTTGSIGRMSMTTPRADSVRSEDLRRLFQMDDKDLDSTTAMEE